jgi:hypothetical protein
MPIINFENNEMTVTTVPCLNEDPVSLIDKAGNLIKTRIVAFQVEGQKAVPVYFPEVPKNTIQLHQFDRYTKVVAFGMIADSPDALSMILKEKCQ